MDSAFTWWEQCWGCSPCRQRLGDLCAGTAVVEEEFSTGNKMLALALWIAVLPGAAWAVPRICSENNAKHNLGTESGRCSGRQNGTLCLFQSRPAQNRYSACFQYGVIGTHVKTTSRAISCAQTWDFDSLVAETQLFLASFVRGTVKFQNPRWP